MHLQVATSINQRPSRLFATFVAFTSLFFISVECASDVKQISVCNYRTFEVKCPKDSKLKIESAVFIAPHLNSTEEQFCETVETGGINETELIQNDQPASDALKVECTHEINVTQVLLARCPNESTCQVDHRDWVYTEQNVCKSKYRILKVNYTCPQIVFNEYKCEGEDISISCPGGRQLKLINATFVSIFSVTGKSCPPFIPDEALERGDEFGLHPATSNWYGYSTCNKTDLTDRLSKKCSGDGCKFLVNKRMLTPEQVKDKCYRDKQLDNMTAIPQYTHNALFVKYECSTTPKVPPTPPRTINSTTESTPKKSTDNVNEPSNVTSTPFSTAESKPEPGHTGFLASFVSAWHFLVNNWKKALTIVATVTFVTICSVLFLFLVKTYNRGTLLINGGNTFTSGAKRSKSECSSEIPGESSWTRFLDKEMV